ncbi:hypothetical protein FVEN_g13140 [Fusarium venenatum]|nr:hypothetical protein FVEN_g13140 [Fusarium venenatum]
MKPTFSTLEVDIRGPHSTLEVDPRQYPADLEVKPADPKSPKVLVGEGQQPSDTGPTRSHTNPWHKSIEVTTTAQSHISTTITTTETTFTTERSTIKSTSTPSPGEAPLFPIYIGGAENGDDRFRIAFVTDQTRAPWCS